MGNYKLLVKTTRVASWVDFETNSIIIGCKGTSDKTLAEDVADDVIIMAAPEYCALTLVDEADKVVDQTLEIMRNNRDELVTGRANSNATPTLIFAGHSLGGTAAMCLTMKYPNSTGVSLNGGAGKFIINVKLLQTLFWKGLDPKDLPTTT